ncbi:MAG: hypothetical protein OQK07_04535 [Rhodospirillales bacterium]|nr:hypothetical protein [Rhodospirillales bacterium]
MNKRSMRFSSLQTRSRAASFVVSFTMGVAALFLCPPSPADAGEHLRRLSAEIAVMKADAGRLVKPGHLSAPNIKGIKDRLRGALSVLPLLVRAARNTGPDLPGLDGSRTVDLRSALAANDIEKLRAGLEELAAAYPFDTAGLLPPDNRSEALRRAREIHEAHCAGCHDDSETAEEERPAWDFFKLAKAIPPEELAARLVIGVRGDSLTALDNPLRNAEISALIAFYYSGK